MPTPANTMIKSFQNYSHTLWEYSYYLRQELRNPAIYLTSMAIGIPVIWIMNAPSIVPFIIPFAVQLAAHAILQFKNRDIETLLLLPGQRQDPAFIMGRSGRIVISTGRTEQLFKKKDIKKIITILA